MAVKNIEMNVKTATGYDQLYPRNNTTLVYTNTSVPTSLWVASSIYTDYPYQATMTLVGATSSYVAHVSFNVTEINSGIYAPVSLTGVNSVTIYAQEIPSSTFIIPSIDLVKEI